MYEEETESAELEERTRRQEATQEERDQDEADGLTDQVLYFSVRCTRTLAFGHRSGGPPVGLGGECIPAATGSACVAI